MPKKKTETESELSPSQIEAVQETLAKLVTLQSVIGAASTQKVECKEAFEDAKDQLKGLHVERSELVDYLLKIKAGTWQEKMFADNPEAGSEVTTEPSAGGVPPTEIPEELWDAALNHRGNCISKKKGLSPSGLSTALFGDRKKDHKNRAELILGTMAGLGLIARTETGKRETTYWPTDTEQE